MLTRGRQGSPGDWVAGFWSASLAASHSPAIVSTAAAAAHRWSVTTGRALGERRSAVDDMTPHAAAPAAFAPGSGGGGRDDARARQAHRRSRTR